MSFLIAVVGLFVGASSTVNCPSYIIEKPVVSDQGSWLVVAESGKRTLQHVGIYLREPVLAAAQVPTSSETTTVSEIVQWKIQRFAGEEVWIGCSYVGTTAMLFRKIPNGVSRCETQYDLLPSGKRLRVHSISCE